MDRSVVNGAVEPRLNHTKLSREVDTFLRSLPGGWSDNGDETWLLSIMTGRRRDGRATIEHMTITSQTSVDAIRDRFGKYVGTRP